jgi:hypothetical protein
MSSWNSIKKIEHGKHKSKKWKTCIAVMVYKDIEIGVGF